MPCMALVVDSRPRTMLPARQQRQPLLPMTPQSQQPRKMTTALLLLQVAVDKGDVCYQIGSRKSGAKLVLLRQQRQQQRRHCHHQKIITQLIGVFFTLTNMRRLIVSNWVRDMLSLYKNVCIMESVYNLPSER